MISRLVNSSDVTDKMQPMILRNRLQNQHYRLVELTVPVYDAKSEAMEDLNNLEFSLMYFGHR
jgi:hypothetical protein